MRMRFTLFRLTLLFVCLIAARPVWAQRPPTTSDTAGIARAILRGCANGQVLVKDSTTSAGVRCATPTAGGSGAPTDATYITKTPNGSLSAEQALSALATGILKSTTTTGVISLAASTDVRSLWTGTCNSSSFLRGDGACAAAGGSLSVPGSGTELQYRASGSTLGAVTGSNVSGEAVSIGGPFLTSISPPAFGYTGSLPVASQHQVYKSFTAQLGPTGGYGDFSSASLSVADANLASADADYNSVVGNMAVASLATGHEPYAVVGQVGIASYTHNAPEGIVTGIIGGMFSAMNTSAMGGIGTVYGLYSEAQANASAAGVMGRQAFSGAHNAATVPSVFGDYNSTTITDTATVANVYQSYLTHFVNTPNLGNWYGVYVTTFGNITASGVRHPFHYEGPSGGKFWVDDVGAATASTVRTTPVAVGSLPTCNAGAEGTHAAVNDSNAVSYTAGIGVVVAAGGSTHVPVVCDGTNWRIG